MSVLVKKHWKCSICDISFSQSYNLKEHMWIHEGRKFTCSLCDRVYQSRKGKAIYVRLTIIINLQWRQKVRFPKVQMPVVRM